MEGVTITSTCYHRRYHTFSLSLAWFGGYLQWVTTRYHQFKKKKKYQNDQGVTQLVIKPFGMS